MRADGVFLVLFLVWTAYQGIELYSLGIARRAEWVRNDEIHNSTLCREKNTRVQAHTVRLEGKFYTCDVASIEVKRGVVGPALSRLVEGWHVYRFVTLDSWWNWLFVVCAVCFAMYLYAQTSQQRYYIDSFMLPGIARDQALLTARRDDTWRGAPRIERIE